MKMKMKHYQPMMQKRWDFTYMSAMTGGGQLPDLEYSTYLKELRQEFTNTLTETTYSQMKSFYTF